MKGKLKKLLSVSISDTEYFNDKQNKAEISDCHQKGDKCNAHNAAFNKSYFEFNRYYLDKDFKNSIKTLKNAFYKTSELNEVTCEKCTNVYRSTIMKSMENIQEELGGMSSGIFRTKRYHSSFIEASNLLNEFQKVG